MSYEALSALILALVGAHYVSLVYEIRRVRDEVSALKADVARASVAAAEASTAVANAVIIARK